MALLLLLLLLQFWRAQCARMSHRNSEPAAHSTYLCKIFSAALPGSLVRSHGFRRFNIKSLRLRRAMPCMRCTGSLYLAYPNERQLSDPFYQALHVGLLRMDLAPEEATQLGILLAEHVRVGPPDSNSDTEDTDLDSDI